MVTVVASAYVDGLEPVKICPKCASIRVNWIAGGLIGAVYKCDDCNYIGKTIIVVTNLKPATFMGHKSEAMLLAAEDEESLSLLTTFSEIKPGTEVH